MNNKEEFEILLYHKDMDSWIHIGFVNTWREREDIGTILSRANSNIIIFRGYELDDNDYLVAKSYVYENGILYNSYGYLISGFRNMILPSFNNKV